MIKQFLQQMIVLQAFIAFTVMAPVAQAKASSPFTSDWVNEFNYSWSLESSVAKAKSIFTTKQDHKDIDEAYQKSKDKNIKWRLAVDGDGAALWQGDKKEFVLNAFSKNSVTVNGMEISLKKGVSYNKFKMDFAKAVKSKSYSLNSLFIDEAHAFFPLFVGAFVAIAAVAASEANASPQKVCLNTYTVPMDQFANDYKAKGKFKSNSRCSSMPTDYQKRLRLVARNFNDNMPFSEKVSGSNLTHRPSCLTKYAGAGPSRSVQVCKCIYRKQLSCNQEGWNMTAKMAAATCQTAYGFWNGCQNPQPQTPTNGHPGPVDTPSPGCVNGKNGQKCTTTVIVAPPIVENPSPQQPGRPKVER